MTIKVGEVIAIKGITITLKIFEQFNKEIIYYKSDKLKGVSIREYVLIQRGFIDIICIVEGEYLDEYRVESNDNKVTYIRKVELKPVGYMRNQTFNSGIKYLPMIKDPAYLLTEKQIAKIFTNYSESEDKGERFKIGNLLKENIPISLPWNRLFNTHIGIFGNTGSGKSNTLAKLYTELFKLKKESIKEKSKFIIIDFNGEYTNDQLIDAKNKKVLKLSTKNSGASDKFRLSIDQIADAEMLALLFQATQNTQKPFIKRVIGGWKKYSQKHATDSLLKYLQYTIKKIFTATNQRKETLDLINSVINSMVVTTPDGLWDKLNRMSWHNRNSQFYIDGEVYFNGDVEYNSHLKKYVDNITLLNDIDFFQELIIRVNLQLIRELLNGYVQFEHIQPLLKRIESFSVELGEVIGEKQGSKEDAENKVLEVGKVIEEKQGSKEDDENKVLEVISLRGCNQDVKKIMPLIIAKSYYEMHKNKGNNPPKETLHLIIDEAHNVLSQQSTREHETWKDYRLELFEEIIKEGRKFGVFLTVCSQRPADISPTIMSQIHNFFIHRLVNDKDLNLLNNTISTLDSLSKSMIPNLAKGSCIITGTTFDMPLVMQIEMLKEREERPDSEDIDLVELWKDVKTD